MNAFAAAVHATTAATRAAAFPHRRGTDCVTAALRNLLESQGLPLRENMVFGLGEGLWYWHCDLADAPFPVLIGQHIGIEELFCRRLGIGLTVHEPRDAQDGRVALERVRAGIPTLVKADPFYLDYMWRELPDQERQHFGEHILLLVAADDEVAWISDIISDTLERVPLAQLEQARHASDGFEFLRPRGRWYELRYPRVCRPLDGAVRDAIASTAHTLLEGTGSFGISGIRRSATQLGAFLAQGLRERPADTRFALWIIVQRLAEGTGTCFRQPFFDFLRHAGQRDLLAVADHYAEPVTGLWRHVIELLGGLADESIVPAAVEAALEHVGTTLTAVAEREEEMCTWLIQTCAR